MAKLWSKSVSPLSERARDCIWQWCIRNVRGLWTRERSVCCVNRARVRIDLIESRRQERNQPIPFSFHSHSLPLSLSLSSNLSDFLALIRVIVDVVVVDIVVVFL